MDIKDPSYWNDANQVDVQNPSYWQDAKAVDAPANSVFDAAGGRTVAVPQTLNASETDFVIKRDADKVKNFFAMQDVGGFDALYKGVKSFFVSQPQVIGSLGKELFEKSLSDKAANPQKYQEYAKAVDEMEALPIVGGMFTWARQLGEKANEKFGGDEELLRKSEALIERNKKYMADAGLERPEQGGLSGVMYDFGQGGGSLLTSLGIAALTRSPETAGLYFGAIQKASVYQEARAAGKTPEQAGDISDLAGLVEGGLETIGLDHFIKALKGNKAVNRFINGFAIEFTQEASQQTGEEIIAQGSGIRSKKFTETIQDILYQGFLGGFLGGGTNVTVGAFVRDEAERKGIDAPTAAKLGAYAEKGYSGATKNLSEFIDKELAPIAKDDASAQEFITLMQKFGNDQELVDRASLDPRTRAIFDQYVEMFNSAKVDTASVAQVEKDFYQQALNAGMDKEEAIGAAKLIGARADAASRALGITPKQWLENQKLELQVDAQQGGEEGDTLKQITPEQAKDTNVNVDLPADPVFAEAVANTKGASITPDGLLINVVRYQKPEQEAGQAVRTGVFYLPEGSKNIRHYKNQDYTKGQNAYGGTEKFEGETLIRRPLFVKGGTGGNAPKAAYDFLKGKGSYEKMASSVRHRVTGNGLSRDLKIENVANILREYGADENFAYPIIDNSKQGNHLSYAVIENIVAHEIRNAGYDAMVSYTKGKAGAAIAEIFDVREQTYPSHVMDSEVHDKFSKDTLNQGGDSAKGSITFGKDGSKIIKLFKGADASTILHELGHLFLRDMQAVAKTTKRPMVRKDYEAVKKFLGAKGNALTVAQEEKFARAFEAYLREGQAPKPELQGVFDRFKKWLETIYSSVKKLNVTLNPEIRQVFDRMLGGDFTQAETLNQSDEAKKMEADYEAVSKMEPKSTFMEDTAGVFRDISNLSADAFVPVSTRLGKIDLGLKHAVRKFIFQTGLYTHEDKVKIKPFIEKASNEMSEQDYRIFDLALKNRDNVKVDFLIDKYGMQEEWAAVREVLDALYLAAQDVGMDMNYIEEYFPRKVRRNMAGLYMAAMRRQEYWSEIEQALKEVDPKSTMTREDQAEFVNNYLRGFASNRINLSRPSFAKERTVDYITPEFNQYYQDSMPTLLQYVGALRHGIEARKLFGKSETDTENNIGEYVLQLVEQGVVKHNEEEELKKLLRAVVEPTGTRGAVSWAKNASYIYLMGNPVSAITQIQDLAFSMWKNGYWQTAKSLAKSLTGNNEITKEDLGIENIMQEFEDENRASASVRTVFKYVGLSFMDNIGKQVYIDGSLARLQKLSESQNAEFNNLLNTVFGEEAVSVKADLEAGKMSENVKYLLFSELSDVQPISLAEMPVGYLRAGNGRIFYMLKTYTVRQLDIYRREIFDEIRSGERDRVVKGLQSLIKLATSLMLMGMASDALKDLLLGREIEVDDMMLDNVAKLFGFSKYQIYKAKTEGIFTAFWKTLFIPPVGAPVDDLVKDVKDIAIGKTDKRTGKHTSKPVKDAEVLQRIPFVGKFYYWWFGGGRAKEEKQAKKKGGKKVSTP